MEPCMVTVRRVLGCESMSSDSDSRDGGKAQLDVQEGSYHDSHILQPRFARLMEAAAVDASTVPVS